jgi:hypothetical protein
MIVPAVGVPAEKERIVPEDRWGKCGDAGNPGIYSGIIPGSINLHALVRAQYVHRIVYSLLKQCVFVRHYLGTQSDGLIS